MQQHPVVFTVGHSTLSVDSFLELLIQHDIEAVADVRSTPFSRFNPQFNKDSLKHALQTRGIKYVFLGKELGARSDDRSMYLNGRVQYSRLAQTHLFRTGIERVMHGAEKQRIALMCAEKEPLECHRTLLVGRALDQRGVDVIHILASGALETHEAAMNRLLDLTGMPREDLFRPKENLVAEALEKQEQKIAYVDEKAVNDTAGDTP